MRNLGERQHGPHRCGVGLASRQVRALGRVDVPFSLRDRAEEAVSFCDLRVEGEHSLRGLLRSRQLVALERFVAALEVRFDLLFDVRGLLRGHWRFAPDPVLC